MGDPLAKERVIKNGKRKRAIGKIFIFSESKIAR
jgi:hypothetical protein